MSPRLDVSKESGSSSSSSSSGEGSSSADPAAKTTGRIRDPDVEEGATPLTGKAAEYGCPADSQTLGRGSWRLLHSMAAYYPQTPSQQQQQDMASFITLLGRLYPCHICAEDFQEWLKTNTPDVSSQPALSRWFCEAHNRVNDKLGKPLFDCNNVNQRWRDGWMDGSCD